MKFIYQYRTSDNVRHEGVVSAANREAAYAILKAQGIKPGVLAEAPGFFNKLFGKGKRWLAIATLGVLVVVAMFIIQSNNRTIRTIEQSRFSPLPRHQIYGDPALLAEYERGGFEEVFDDLGERLLARYAQPGLVIQGEMAAAEVLRGCLGHEIVFQEGEARESVELKRIVLWMKGELRTYLSAGTGTPETYLARLEERQNAEAKIYADIRTELQTERDFDVWERKNETLRNLGLRTIPLPSRDD